MSYNKENFIRIRREFEAKHLKAKDEADALLDALHARLPELKAIDAELAGTGVRLMQAIAGGGEGIDARVAQVRKVNEELQRLRADCLRAAGYPEDCTDPKYECPACGDTGYQGTKMCSCMKRSLVLAGYESSGVGGLIKTQSFETFSLDYYADDPRALENMRVVLTACRDYAASFGAGGRSNLLLCGATGLGKTHLSTSIAKAVIDRAFDVVYDTAQNVFGDFEYERFVRTYGDTSESRTVKYFDCDLVILDDLGAEVTNQFTVSCLYNLINTRLNADKSMIINTNLTRDELRKRYSDRITSRLFGEFMPLVFMGRDIREKKLR